MILLGFAAYSGNGKTTLIEGLIPLLVARGLKVSVIKHSHHAFEVDRPGKDSHRYRQAGATDVQMIFGGPADPDLPKLLDRITPSDLVLVEGFKNAPIPKIEVHRMAAGTRLLFPDDRRIIALATDAPVVTTLPMFGLNDQPAIARFLVGHLGLG